MKVVVKDTPLIVEDQKGNVLFQWFPSQEVNINTVINNEQDFDLNTTELAKRIIEKMKKDFETKNLRKGATY